MKIAAFLGGGKAASPYMAALAYTALILVLVTVSAMSWINLQGRRAEVTALSDILMHLEGRNSQSARAVTGSGAGSYFLEGGTVTVAAAALLQRVIGVVTQHGGSVLSSQVDLQGTQSKDGFLNVIASCVMEQSALQEIVYDLEAGTPFLFVERLDVQAASASASAVGGKLRVLFSVSGQWRAAR